MTALAEWRDFYVVLGTAAGVIIGATFVVASLATGMKERELGMRGFITPTAVHLGSVLIGSAILAVPSLTPLGFVLLLGCGGVGGMIYGVVVAVRIGAMPLDLSDRAFYMILPILAYGLLAAAALMAWKSGWPALETLAAALIALLVVGMRNAWDMASFMIMRTPRQ